MAVRTVVAPLQRNRGDQTAVHYSRELHLGHHDLQTNVQNHDEVEH
jgi:hypothetical protein